MTFEKTTRLKLQLYRSELMRELCLDNDVTRNAIFYSSFDEYAVKKITRLSYYIHDAIDP